MEKLENSSDWAVKELARLQKMASKKGALAGKQLEDLQVGVPCSQSLPADSTEMYCIFVQVRQNILQAFTAAKGAASSVASDASASLDSAASQASATIGSVASQASASASSVSKSASSLAESATARVKAEL